MKERTLVLLKPDAVARGLVGEILSRFEARGFKIIQLRMLRMDRSVAEAFYSPHKGKEFFSELISFMTSGPVVALILEGEGVLAATRTMMGTTSPLEAAPGTIRGDFATTITENLIHGSDSEESFYREARIIFPDLY